jgi:regulator of protease activity HflC (stomatin/prohibitin superfamily)
MAIPFVDKIAYIIDIRERAMDIAPQAAITRDNVSVEVSGNLFVRFNDAEKAAYGAFNPLYSVTQVRGLGATFECFLLGFKVLIAYNVLSSLKTVIRFFLHSCMIN